MLTPKSKTSEQKPVPAKHCGRNSTSQLYEAACAELSLGGPQSHECTFRLLEDSVAAASGAASGSIAAANTLVAGDGQHCSIGPCGNLVHIRQNVTAVGNDVSYYRLRRTLAAQAINPWLRSWMDGLDETLPLRFEALVEVRHENGGMVFGTLLDFSEIFDPEDIAPELSFVEWLLRFQPVGRDDFLMALPLYRYYGHTGEVVPARKPMADPWLDAMLRSTRGMLIWTGQWTELIRVAGGVGTAQALQLVRGYCRGDPGATAALNDMRYVGTGQRVTQVIEERSLGQQPWGGPDYLVADWLNHHWKTA